MFAFQNPESAPRGLPLPQAACHAVRLVGQPAKEKEIDSMGEKERKKCQFGQVLIIADATVPQRGRRERGREECCVLVSVVAATVLHVARST